MEMSEKIDALAEALAKAQGEMKNAVKGCDNPFFKSKYADLAECLNVAREPLSKNGLSIFQANEGIVESNKLAVTTLIMHSSGQFIKVTSSYPIQKNDAQGFGSTLTYARRYSLAAALGLAQEDDDGNLACAPVEKGQYQPKEPKKEQKPKAQPQATGDKFVKITPQGDIVVTVANGHDKNGRPLAAYKNIKDLTIEELEKMVTIPQYALAHTAIKTLLEEMGQTA
jgi:hypothetical protein|nr:MAG TPA: ERF superfamily protein [Caudoviricetes sp.]